MECLFHIEASECHEQNFCGSRSTNILFINSINLHALNSIFFLFIKICCPFLQDYITADSLDSCENRKDSEDFTDVYFEILTNWGNPQFVGLTEVGYIIGKT